MTPEEEAYKAIGLVVVNAQFFEFAFLVCSKLALTQEAVADLAGVNPLGLSFAFKQPTTAVLRELRTRVELSPDFEAKLESVVQRRHELIHRWLLKHRWPDTSDEPGLNAVVQFANQLSIELNALTRILVEAINAWLVHRYGSSVTYSHTTRRQQVGGVPLCAARAARGRGA
jgi:hypothetical protein